MVFEKPKDIAVAIGVVLVAIGAMCLPAGYGVSPKRDLSLFDNIADSGAFVKAGAGLMCLGVLTLVFSRFVRDD